MDSNKNYQEPLYVMMSEMRNHVNYYALPILLTVTCIALLSKIRFIPTELYAILFGGILGVVGKWVSIYSFIPEVTWCGRHLLVVLQTINVLKLIYGLDVWLFVKSLQQISLICFVLYFIHLILCGFVVILLGKSEDVQFSNISMAAIVLLPIEVPELLVDIEAVKNVKILLIGESIFLTSVCLASFIITLGYYEGIVTEWYHFVILYIRYLAFPIPIGFIIGKLVCPYFHLMCSDGLSAICIIVSSIVIIYFICEEFIFCSGTLAAFIVMFLLTQERDKLTTEVDQHVKTVISVLYIVIQHIMLFCLSAYLIMHSKNLHKPQNVAVAIGIYISVNVSRLITFLVISPILSRIGVNFGFSSMTTVFWAAKKGPIHLVFGVVLNKKHIRIGSDLDVFSVIFIFMIYLINGSSLKVILKKFNLVQISPARQININNCFKFIQDRQNHLLASMKMNRFFSDANWSLIQTVTTLTNQYKQSEDDDIYEDTYIWSQRQTMCPSCHKNIPVEPTKKEFQNMIKEVRLRALKAQKISYVRQYETGILNQDGIRALQQAVDTAMNSPNLVIKLDDLFKLFHEKNFALRAKTFLLNNVELHVINIPSSGLRHYCYVIFRNKIIYYSIYFPVLLIHMVSIGTLLALEDVSVYYHIVQYMFFLPYILDFAVKLIAHSTTSTNDGFRRYIRYAWNKFDFILLILMIVDLPIYVYLAHFSPYTMYAEWLVDYKIIRVLRFISILEMMYPRLIKYCDMKIDVRISYAFLIARALVVGYEEVLELLPKICDNNTIREDIRSQVEYDRLAITKEIGRLENERPWIAVKVKTRQAMTSALNYMKNTITELQTAGFVDNFEYYKLQASLTKCSEKLSDYRIPNITPRNIFYEIPWIGGDEIDDFLFSNAIMRIWHSGEEICRYEELSEGIFVLIKGLFEMRYSPSAECTKKLGNYGILPVKDCIKNSRFNEDQYECFMVGNTVGELSCLTQRPYNAIVTAKTPSQAFVISTATLDEAYGISKDPVNGLKARMWKYACWNLAKNILADTPRYRSATNEQLHAMLHRGFVPNLSCYKIFIISEIIEDVALVEGYVVDFHSREIFTAPCYIPRHVHRIILPDQNVIDYQTVVDVKLFIIPIQEVNEYELMIYEEKISDLSSTIGSKCLLSGNVDKTIYQQRTKRNAMILLKGFTADLYDSRPMMRKATDIFSQQNRAPSIGSDLIIKNLPQGSLLLDAPTLIHKQKTEITQTDPTQSLQANEDDAYNSQIALAIIKDSLTDVTASKRVSVAAARGLSNLERHHLSALRRESHISQSVRASIRKSKVDILSP